MKEYYYLVEDKSKLKKLLINFVKKYHVPTIENELVVYCSLNSRTELHIKITSKRTSLRIKEKDKNYLATEQISPIIIKSQELKILLRLLRDLKVNKGSISEAVKMTFKNDIKGEVYIMTDTLIGDFVVCKSTDEEEIESFGKVMKDFGIGVLDNLDKNKLTQKISLKEEILESKLYKINDKIVSFCERNAIPLYAFDRSIDSLTKAHSNDYSNLEIALRNLFDINLLEKNSNIKKDMFCPISIIIPFYNSNETLEKVLLSIQNQNLTVEQKNKIEIVCVDDGSTVPLMETFRLYNSVKDDIKIKIIRLENNCGLSTARNVGASVSSYETLLFMDSDILLPSNYLIEMSARSNFIPNAIFIGFKENINMNSPKIAVAKIKKGLSVPDISKDSRIIKNISIEKGGLYNMSEANVVNVLADTDNFKKLGFGRNLGVYDLPSMVVGHNMVCSKKIFNATGGFSNNFIGWGMEDTYFGARIIASGNFVIPVLSTGVYHIDHSPRSGNEKKKEEEFKNNLDTYKRLLNEKLLF